MPLNRMKAIRSRAAGHSGKMPYHLPMAGRATERFIWILLLLILAGAAFYGGVLFERSYIFNRTTYPSRVVNIVDGDTIDVEWFGGVARLRVIGIDCFETRPNKKLRKQAEDWNITEKRALDLGNQAKEVAEKSLLDKEVEVRFAGKKIERDAFGRLLGYVYLGDKDFGKHLIQWGLAYPRPEDHVREKYYEWPEMQAKNDKRGVYDRD